FPAIRGGLDRDPEVFEDRAHEQLEIGIVVDDQHRRAHGIGASGNRTRIVVPVRSALSNVISPPCLRTISLLRNRPITRPPRSNSVLVCARKNGVKILLWSARGMPIPWSRTVRYNEPSRAESPTKISPPSGE